MALEHCDNCMNDAGEARYRCLVLDKDLQDVVLSGAECHGYQRHAYEHRGIRTEGYWK